MSAYWIGRTQAHDPEGLRRYSQLVARATAIYPNQALARAGNYKVLEGPDAFNRYVVLRFGSMEQALIFYNSPEYQEAAAIRHACTERSELVITEGTD